MKLRSHLIILVIAALVPSLILAAVMLVYFNKQQRLAVQNRLMGMSRSLSLVLDHELEGSIRALQALATSQHLESGDFRQFHERARLVMKTQEGWSTIILFDSGGRQRMNLLRPFASPLPRDPPADPGVKNTIALKRPFVSDLFVARIAGEPRVAVNVPVIRNGRVEHVLGANFSPTSLLALLQQATIPANWHVTVIDRNGLIVARRPEHENHVGKPESPAIAAESKKARAGMFQAIPYEGEPVYAGFHRSEFSGWTVVLAGPND